MTVELATEAMAVLGSFLGAAGADAAKDVTKDAIKGGGKRLLAWLRAHLPDGGTALAQLEAVPQSKAKQKLIEGQLASLLEDEPALVDELRALLPAANAATVKMTQNIGDGSEGYQVNGSNISINSR